MDVVRIENWLKYTHVDDCWTPPELGSQVLHGQVFGHPSFEDGERVHTSNLEGWDEEHQAVVTHSGRRYILGQVDPEYETKFPNAKERLIESLKKIQ